MLACTAKQADKESLMNLEEPLHQSYSRHARTVLLGAWLFDILSLCMALAVFAGVITILAIYNGHPNPLWTGGITLNTVISVASMLFRISLMISTASCINQLSLAWFVRDRRPLYDLARFDQASRSLYGSFQLLFSHYVQ
jgi:hypothetical protein